MLQAAAPYARWIDVFCEPHSPHAFDADEARHILKAGAAAGPRAAGAWQPARTGTRRSAGGELGAASVDHCTYLDDADVDALAAAAENTVATLLPGVEFCTRSPYPDAARLLAAGVSIALATDCNPGTCYSSSMPWVISLAVREMGLTPAQALFAATAGSAKSLRRSDIGRLVLGNRADLRCSTHPHTCIWPIALECRSLGPLDEFAITAPQAIAQPRHAAKLWRSDLQVLPDERRHAARRTHVRSRHRSRSAACRACRPRSASRCPRSGSPAAASPSENSIVRG